MGAIRDLSHRVYGLTEKQRLRHHAEEDENGCWVWQLHLLRGYGRFARSDGTKAVAHRASYELHKGPIPDGWEIGHLCGNRACVNPAHLEALTRQEHSRREVERRHQNWTTCQAGKHPYPENRMVEASTGRTRCRGCKNDASRRHKRKRRGQFGG